ncbi:hypothetical protein EC973_006733, partial [Apophysomyces ossiformis]
NQKTTGKTKCTLAKEFCEWLETKYKCVQTQQQVINKVKYFEKQYRCAYIYLNKTGEGLTDYDAKLGIIKKVDEICLDFEKLDAFMRTRPINNPPYVNSSDAPSNIENILFANHEGTCETDREDSIEPAEQSQDVEEKEN